MALFVNFVPAIEIAELGLIWGGAPVAIRNSRVPQVPSRRHRSEACYSSQKAEAEQISLAEMNSDLNSI